MRLKIHQVLSAKLALDNIIQARREMPQIGKYLLARMHIKLAPECVLANDQREALIRKHGETRPDGQFGVSDEKLAEFLAEWTPIADTEVEIDVEPISITSRAFGDAELLANGVLEAGELVKLGDLVSL